MSKKQVGRCALCGREKELTFEHIPPRKAFNWFPAKVVGGDACINSVASNRKPWDFSGLPYNNLQSGIGAFCLCSECNNNTGAWYGEEFVRFAQGFHRLMVQAKPAAGMMVPVEEATFRPLPVFKQVVSMFCSLNRTALDDSPIGTLRDFVLDKTKVGLPKNKFRLGMYLFASGIRRQAPISVRILKDPAGETRFEVISEIAAYPVGFVLYLDPDDDLKMHCPDITGFCDFQYDEECTIKIDLPVYECNIMFAGDFRSKSEIEQCIRKE